MHPRYRSSLAVACTVLALSAASADIIVDDSLEGDERVITIAEPLDLESFLPGVREHLTKDAFAADSAWDGVVITVDWNVDWNTEASGGDMLQTDFEERPVPGHEFDGWTVDDSRDWDSAAGPLDHLLVDDGAASGGPDLASCWWGLELCVLPPAFEMGSVDGEPWAVVEDADQTAFVLEMVDGAMDETLMLPDRGLPGVVPEAWWRSFAAAPGLHAALVPAPSAFALLGVAGLRSRRRR